MRASVAELPFDAVWDGSRQGELQSRVLARTQAVIDGWVKEVSGKGVDGKAMLGHARALIARHGR